MFFVGVPGNYYCLRIMFVLNHYRNEKVLESTPSIRIGFQYYRMSKGEIAYYCT